MLKGLLTIGLLVVSNTFMTVAWYGHLRLAQTPWGARLALWAIVLLSWGVALLEYSFQVPANRIGFEGNGGPFSLMQLKVIQEVISLTVFTVMATLLFQGEQLRTNHLIAFAFLVLAVYFMFKK